MEPSVGQRTGRTWVFVSVLSVRRFFPCSDCADEGSNGSNWMPKSLEERGKETLHTCDFSRLEWDLQYLCKLVTKSFFFFLTDHERCREPFDGLSAVTFLVPSSIVPQLCCSQVGFQPKPDAILSLHNCLRVFFTIVCDTFC